MPYNIRKQKCKQSDGDAGKYVLSYTDNKGKKHRACHTSRKKARGQIAAIEAEGVENDESFVFEQDEELLRNLVRELFNDDSVSGGQLNTTTETKMRRKQHENYENEPEAFEMTVGELRKMVRELVEESVRSKKAKEAKKSLKNDKDADGDEDFADVMMARRIASGESEKEALKKSRKHDK